MCTNFIFHAKNTKTCLKLALDIKLKHKTRYNGRFLADSRETSSLKVISSIFYFQINLAET